MRGNGFIKLRIVGQNLKFEEITEKLSQQPNFTYRKGDTYTPKYGDKKRIVYTEDCWLLNIEKDKDKSFDDAINNFLSRLKNSADYLMGLSNKFDVALCVSVYPDDEQSNVHLSPDTLRLIASMGISVDFNIMFLKEFYDGTYMD